MKKHSNLPLIIVGAVGAYMLFGKKAAAKTTVTTPIVIKPQPLPQPTPVINNKLPAPASAPVPAPVVKAQTPVNPTATKTVTVSNNIASYEGKFVNDTKTGTAYKVINGKLYFLKSWSEVGGQQPFAYSGLITNWPIAGSYADYLTKLNVTPAVKTPATPNNTIPKQVIDVQKPGGAVQQQINVTKPKVQAPVLMPVANQTPGLVTTAGKVLSILNGTPVGQTGGNVSKTTVTSKGAQR